MARNLCDVIPELVKLTLPTGTWTIGLSDFLDIMTKNDNAKLLTSWGFRKFVLKHGGFARRSEKKSNIYQVLMRRKLESICRETNRILTQPGYTKLKKEKLKKQKRARLQTSPEKSF